MNRKRKFWNFYVNSLDFAVLVKFVRFSAFFDECTKLREFKTNFQFNGSNNVRFFRRAQKKNFPRSSRVAESRNSENRRSSQKIRKRPDHRIRRKRKRQNRRKRRNREKKMQTSKPPKNPKTPRPPSRKRRK